MLICGPARTPIENIHIAWSAIRAEVIVSGRKKPIARAVKAMTRSTRHGMRPKVYSSVKQTFGAGTCSAGGLGMVTFEDGALAAGGLWK